VIQDILSFWMDLGVVGFRFDAVTHMFEDELMRDEPRSGQDVPPDNYNFLSHIHTQNLPETPYTLSLFRSHLDEYEANAGDGLHRWIFFTSF
jgi:alpha-glucosidase